MKTAKPVLLNENNILQLAKVVNKYIKQTFYNILVDIYKKQFNKTIKLNNSIEDNIINDIVNYKLYVVDNKIYSSKGVFNSRQTRELEKLGGVYSKIKKCFVFKYIPSNILNVVVNNQSIIQNYNSNIDSFISEYINNIDESINLLDIDFLNVIADYNKQLINNLSEFGIQPNFNEYEIKDINKDYINNFKLDIKNMTINNIQRLREKINDYVFNKGYNTEYIAKLIRDNFDIEQKRSLFIARQECNLLLATYTKSKYNNMGFNRYKWLTANDERVRDYPKNNEGGGNHKRLNNQVFSFDEPPIVNLLTGERANPSEQYNCRCVASIIIE